MNFFDSAQPTNNIILLLHGLGADGQSWKFQISEFNKAGWRTIVPDIPGFGKSTETDHHWSFRKVTGELVDLLHDLNIDRFSVMGISMGGALALHIALDYPKSIRSLVLVNSFARFKPQGPNEIKYFIKRGFQVITKSPANQASLVANRIFPNPDQEFFRQTLISNIQHSNKKIYRLAMLEIARMNRVAELKNIAIPTLVVSGGNDTTIPLPSQQELADNIPSSLHKIIPNGGHAVNVDHWEEFNRVVLDFLCQKFVS